MKSKAIRASEFRSVAQFATTLAFLFVVILHGSAGFAADDEPPAQPKFSANEIKFFEERVKPILKANCFKCHGGEEKIRGGLRLTSRKNVLKGGDLGPAVDLDDLESSTLLDAINYEGLEMPPSGKLSDPEIAVLTTWVKAGIPWTAGDGDHAADHVEEEGPPQVTEEAKQFWSFQPVQRPDVPQPVGRDWVKNPIDAFILHRLEQADLTPAPPANRTALLRRVYFNLIGLPPSPAQVQEFLNDDNPEAYERVVDQLLDSPQYGERWARHWLDLVRYAESNSYERDNPKPNVWRYRDYVIRAFNDDKPYNEFLTEQLAGDELPEVTRETLIATGYYRLGIWDDEPTDHLQALYDDLDDIVATTSQAMLGLTVNCARCHDHKLDPIPQADYYKLLAFFSGYQRYGVRSNETIRAQSIRSIATEEQKQKQAVEVAAHKKRVEANAKQIAAIEELVKADFIPVEHEEFRDEGKRKHLLKKRVPRLLSKEQFAEYERLCKRRNRLRKFKPSAMDEALCITEVGRKPRDFHLLIRGNAHAPGDKVEPAFLSVLSPPDPIIIPPKSNPNSSGRRLAFARWVASEINPLTARVMVNRIWQHQFGRGIVRSSNNFGFQGDAPTHPQLLDWLAAELMAGDWKLKRIQKLIVMSNTFQMSSEFNETAYEKDPLNDLLWRFNMRRLEAEEVRDSLLAVNGSLNVDKMYGPSIYPIIPKEVLAGQSMPGNNWGDSPPDDLARRSIYIHIKRSVVLPLMASFDVADTDSTCPVRFATTQPTQALGMLNSDFVNRQARVFAEYLKTQTKDNPAEMVQLALGRVLQRPPSETEIDRGIDFLNSLQTEYGHDADGALEMFCLLALNLNEFLYLD